MSEETTVESEQLHRRVADRVDTVAVDGDAPERLTELMGLEAPAADAPGHPVFQEPTPPARVSGL